MLSSQDSEGSGDLGTGGILMMAGVTGRWQEIMSSMQERTTAQP